MPHYTYECKKCHQEIEIEHGIKEAAVTHQDHRDRRREDVRCQGRLKRLISPCSFQFSGGAPTPKTFV